MSTEQFIIDSARRGWSRGQVAQALGLTRANLAIVLDAMAPVEWPGNNQSLARKLSDEARRGYCSPAQSAALEAFRVRRAQRSTHTVGAHTGTIDQIAPKYGISPATVRRRMKAGATLEQALSQPVTPPGERHKGSNKRTTA